MPTPGEEFESLMRAAQGGDSKAYERLLKTLTPILHGMIRQQRKFLPSADIEDLVQDVLISMHSVRATYDPSRPFMPWLIAIMRNRLVDGARRYARQQAHEVNVGEYPVTLEDPQANNVTELYRDPQELRRAIDRLPSSQRQALEMLKLREMTLREAAAASGTNVGALKVSVHRAMGALRKALKKD